MTLVALSNPPAIIDRASIPATGLAADAVVRAMTTGDFVELTQPAYRNTPAGDGAQVFTATGATVHRSERQGLERVLEAGAPLPTMERLEVACARVGADAQAVVAATPPLGRFHELLPHQAGHPGAPAAVEVHGTGVVLTGPAAVAVAEYTRDRTSHTTFDLALAAATPFAVPPDPASPTRWAAVLRTVAAGTEMEPGAAEAIATANAGFPFGQSLDTIRQRLATLGITLPGGIDAAAESVVRAIDRRVVVASRGAREGATSLVAAIRRAEDLVYIETPALADSELGETNTSGQNIDRLALWEALKTRMDERPGLRVLVCTSVRHMPGLPGPLRRMRDALLLEAITSLRTGGTVTPREGRFAVFMPAAGPVRTLRLASTTVVVDDAYALTGTTHLWRRGLSFDSSLAAAVFDERLDRGRPAEVRRFRRQLVAGRLGLSESLVPDDPAELIDAVTLLSARGGLARLATEEIELPSPAPTDIDRTVWDRDGSPQPNFDIIGWLTTLAADIRGQLAEDLPPAP